LIKKENARKEIQIRKLTNENKKSAFSALKNKDELKKVKKINEMLKMLMKPLKKMRRATDLEENTDKIEEKSSIQKKEIENMVNDCVHNLLLKIDRDFDL